MMVKNAKWWSKSNLPLFLAAILYPVLKGFQKYWGDAFFHYFKKATLDNLVPNDAKKLY